MNREVLVISILIVSCCWGCAMVSPNMEILRPNQLTVEKAYEQYEVYMFHFTPSNKKSDLNPGSITVDWEKATLSTNSVNSYVNVPLQATYNYKVKSVRNKEWVKVVQKLCVVQEDTTQRYSIYVLNVAPEGNFENKSRDYIIRSCKGGEMPNKFSGLVIYTKLFGGLPVYAARYWEGELIKEVFIFDKNYEFSENLDRLNAVLRDYELKYDDGADSFAAPGTTNN